MTAATVAVVVTLVIAARLRPQATARENASMSRRHGPTRRRALVRRAERALPDAIDLFVLAVRAGHLPSAAIDIVLPHLDTALRPAFNEVSDAVHDGVRFADALTRLPQRLGPLAAPLADSLIAADRYGLPLAPVLDRLADEARQHRRRLVDASARQLPVRLSLPLVLCTLPSFVLLAVVPLLLAAFASLNR
ncbi:MAG: type II secretion system F family protein [Actinomycetia bacterium]|nr:type II secretion system F family protein [Actinomycetes bacterium]